jgi:hypothetical protein
MTITKNPGRQEVIVAYVDVALADIATGVAQNAIALPPGAIIVGGDIVATTAFDSTSTDVVDIGYAGSENAYKNDASVRTAIRTALIPTGYEHTASTPNVRVTWVSGGGTPAAGAFRLTVHYIVRDRAAFSQG